MVNIKDLRKENIDSLRNRLKDLEKEILNTLFDIKTGKSKNTAQLRSLKKDYARVLTVISELETIKEYAK